MHVCMHKQGHMHECMQTHTLVQGKPSTTSASDSEGY